MCARSFFRNVNYECVANALFNLRAVRDQKKIDHRLIVRTCCICILPTPNSRIFYEDAVLSIQYLVGGWDRALWAALHVTTTWRKFRGLHNVPVLVAPLQSRSSEIIQELADRS